MWRNVFWKNVHAAPTGRAWFMESPEIWIFKFGVNLNYLWILQIVQKIKTYEEQTGQEVKYIEIKNDIIPRKNVDYKFLFKSMILTARFNEQIVKIYTDVDLERKYFEEEDIEKVKYDTIVCSGDTVYVLVK